MRLSTPGGFGAWGIAILVSVVPGQVLPAQGVDSSAIRALRGHIEFLAHDALRGRGSGTRDELIAATYLAAQLRSYGVMPAGDAGGYVQTVRMTRRSPAGPPVLSAAMTRWTHGDEIAVVTLDRSGAQGPLARPGAAGAFPPGAFVLASVDSAAGLRAILAEATRLAQAGAAVVLVPAPGSLEARWDALAANYRGLSASFIDAVDSASLRPTIVLLKPVVVTALQGLPAGTALMLTVPLGAPDTSYTWNVQGVLRGRDRATAGEVILLSAHYDHVGVRAPVNGDSIYNGADDDASGTAAVLELARRLAAAPRPRRTVYFVLFGSEEGGGLGSRYYLARPPVPLERHVAQIQFEMLGRPDSAVAPGTLWLTGYERSTLGPVLARFGAPLVPDPHPEQNFFQRSDNYPFALRGIVAHTVSSYGLHLDYHRPSDEVGKIDFAHLAQAVSVLVEPIRRLADGPERPAWVPDGKP